MVIHAFLAGADFVGQVSEKQMADDPDSVLVMDRACRVIYDQKNNMLLQAVRGNPNSPQTDGNVYLDRRSLSYVILDERGNIYKKWQEATSPISVVGSN